jgi:hypothetical protein
MISAGQNIIITNTETGDVNAHLNVGTNEYQQVEIPGSLMGGGTDAAGGIGGPNMAVAGGMASIGSSVGQIVGGIASYYLQSDILDTQTKMIKDGLDHKAAMAGHDRDMKMDALKGQEAKIKVQVKGNKEYLAAVRERRKAEGELACAEAQEHENELSEKAGKVNTKALDNIFQNYSYGKPLKA